VWVLDQDTGSEWKIRRDEHLQQMVKDRWNERKAFIVVDVVSKGGCTDKGSSAARCVSGVTNGSHVGPSHVPDDAEECGDTCSSPPPPPPPAEQPVAVDWNTLTIQENPDDDGLATQLVDEEQVYEAMGFKEAEEQEAARNEVPIPVITAEMEADMNEAAVNVDDTIDAEPMYEWDRDNPDMSVGTCYPNMDEFRLAVRQHAIKKEFELDTKHSDKERYRANCACLGCPWFIRGRTQHDGSVRVQILNCLCTCCYFLNVIFCIVTIFFLYSCVFFCL